MTVILLFLHFPRVQTTHISLFIVGLLQSSCQINKTRKFLPKKNLESERNI